MTLSIRFPIHVSRAALAATLCLPGLAWSQLNTPLTGRQGAAAVPAASNAAPGAGYRVAPASLSSGAPAAASTVAPAPAVQAVGAEPRRANTVGVVRQVGPDAPPAARAAQAPARQNASRRQEGRDEQVGDVTRALLEAQADGRRAAPELPMLGSVASASYKRYLDSFSQPIPQWFSTRVNSGSGGGESSGN